MEKENNVDDVEQETPTESPEEVKSEELPEKPKEETREKPMTTEEVEKAVELMKTMNSFDQIAISLLMQKKSIEEKIDNVVNGKVKSLEAIDTFEETMKEKYVIKYLKGINLEKGALIGSTQPGMKDMMKMAQANAQAKLQEKKDMEAKEKEPKTEIKTEKE